MRQKDIFPYDLSGSKSTVELHRASLLPAAFAVLAVASITLYQRYACAV